MNRFWIKREVRKGKNSGKHSLFPLFFLSLLLFPWKFREREREREERERKRKNPKKEK